MLYQYIQKLTRNCQDYGITVALQKILTTAIKPVFIKKSYRLYRIEVASSPMKSIFDSSFSFRCIRANETEIIDQIETMEEWLKGKVKSKIRNGGLCLVALDNDFVAGFNLIQFNEIDIPLIQYRKKLCPQRAFSEQITVLKKYRGRGLATSIRYAIFHELSKLGVNKLYGGAQRSNAGSLKLAQKTGFTFLADITFTKILLYRNITLKRIRCGTGKHC